MDAKDIFVSRMIWIIISIILILLGIYIYYIRNLESKECSFMENLYSKIDGNLRSINPSDPKCGYTFKDYYIKSAYNCCSGGSYKNDYVSICNLKAIIRQGVRGLDFEIYNINEQPVIATSTVDNYFVKETYNYVPFGDAINIIKNYAFSAGTCPNPNDPIILHLRIKSTNQEMYGNMANIFKYCETYLLDKQYSFENQNKNLGDVPLLNLSNKIIIIVDRLNTSFMENKQFMEFVNMTSNSMFMRALHFYDIIYTPDLSELQTYNKKNMTIAMPDKGEDPPNPSTIAVREAGCQMIAIRYQKVDQYLEENALFFDRAGYAFVLKPDKLRFIPTVIEKPNEQKPEYDYATRTVVEDYFSFNI